MTTTSATSRGSVPAATAVLLTALRSHLSLWQGLYAVTCDSEHSATVTDTAGTSGVEIAYDPGSDLFTVTILGTGATLTANKAAEALTAVCDALGIDRPGSYASGGAARTRHCTRCGRVAYAWETDCLPGGGGEHHPARSAWAPATR